LHINNNYLNLKDSYLFATVANKVAAYKEANPDKKIIRLDIGDVTLPLCQAVVDAMKAASDEMGKKETFRGYAPYQGYDFIQNAVAGYYKNRQVDLDLTEIFVSDGAKSDIGNILDIFSADNQVLIPDPVYPVYVDTNIMAGRRTSYLDAKEENGFLPVPGPDTKGDIIYICSPNNPTGAVYNKSQLKAWVDFAVKNNAVILFDAAYEAFIDDAELPKSIYEIEGAKQCAIEFGSLSKTAGFTGTRCGYTIVPHELVSEGVSLNSLWLRRQSTKFNGSPYIIQRGAEAVFSPEGQRQTKENIAYYKENARLISQALDKMGIWYTGGQHSPYIWFKCPNNLGSWEFFDLLLDKAQLTGTPGEGFGANGKGFFRLTGFGSKEDVQEAVVRLAGIMNMI